MNQRLIPAAGVLVNGADVIEYVGFIREIADIAVYRQCLPASSKPVFITALIMVDASNVVVQDRLVLRPAYLTEYFQRPLVAFERVSVVTAIQLHPS